MTAATSTRRIVDFADTGACIDPDVSMTTSVRSNEGTFCVVRSSVAPSAAFQLSDGAFEYAAHTWYGNRRAFATSSASVILARTVLTERREIPCSSKLRRLRINAMTPMVGMTASHASASIPPGSQPARRSHDVPALASASAPSARSFARRSSVGISAWAVEAARTGSTFGSATASLW